MRQQHAVVMKTDTVSSRNRQSTNFAFSRPSSKIARMSSPGFRWCVRGLVRVALCTVSSHSPPDRTPAIHVPIPERSAPPAARHSTLHDGLHLLVLAVCLMSRLVRFSDAFAVSMPDNAAFDGGSQVDGMGLLISCDAGSVHSTSTIATTRSRQCFSLSPILHFGDHAQPADCAHVGHV